MMCLLYLLRTSPSSRWRNYHWHEVNFDLCMSPETLKWQKGSPVLLNLQAWLKCQHISFLNVKNIFILSLKILKISKMLTIYFYLNRHVLLFWKCYWTNCTFLLKFSKYSFKNYVKLIKKMLQLDRRRGNIRNRDEVFNFILNNFLFHFILFLF